jgi:hypothetical protein
MTTSSKYARNRRAGPATRCRNTMCSGVSIATSVSRGTRAAYKGCDACASRGLKVQAPGWACPEPRAPRAGRLRRRRAVAPPGCGRGRRRAATTGPARLRVRRSASRSRRRSTCAETPERHHVAGDRACGAGARIHRDPDARVVVLLGDVQGVLERVEVSRRDELAIPRDRFAFVASHETLGAQDRHEDAGPGGGVRRHELRARMIVDSPRPSVG